MSAVGSTSASAPGLDDSTVSTVTFADAMQAADRPRKLVVSSQRLGTGEVTMTVQDSGIGVDPAVFDKLFDPFFTTKADGMGLGLSVSRTIVESHGGRLWASMNDGPGATFHVALPVVA